MGITTFHALASLTELLSFERPLYYNLQLQRSIQFSKSIKGSCKLVRRWSSVQAKNDSVEVNRINKEQFLTDCGPDQQCVIGGIVALGKFDALHVGHRELAIQASKAGVPFLLSFVGMADVLGWEKRLPLVADCDRKRVLSSWAPLCAGMIPHEYHVQFSLVRHLSPRQFVERLSNELGVKGVVAGANYRFGYKASGDTSDLVHLCEEYGLKAFIVDPVMDMTIDSRATQSTAEADKKEKGQVSSTQVHKALAAGNVKRANKLLGRKHRLLISTKESSFTEKGLVAYNSSLLNQPPGEGEYACDVLMESLHSVNSDNYSAESIIGSATLKISSNYLELYLRDGSFAGILDDDCYIGLDFLG